MPKFPDVATWQQAEQLMQPAFIRLVDQLRQQLEQSSWKGTYEDVQVWSEDISDVIRLRVTQLQTELQTADADEAIAIESALAQLPSPYPGYQLQLQQADRQVTVDLWHLCYEICFQNYDAASGTSRTPGDSNHLGVNPGVSIDADLFEATGAVDWHRLDRKARCIVEQLFANLPTDASEC